MSAGIIILIAAGIAGFGSSLFLPVPQSLRTHFDAAQEFYVLGEYQYAINEYSKITDFDSKVVDEDKIEVEFLGGQELPIKDAAWYQLGQSYKKSDRFDQATDAFRQVIESPTVAEDFKATVQFEIANTRFLRGEFAEAAEEYDTYREIFPNSHKVGEAFFRGGWSRFKMGSYNDAIATLEDMLADYPDDKFAPDAQFRIGSSYFEKGEYERAIEVCYRVLQHYPESTTIANATYLRANSLDKMQRSDEAIESYQEVIDLYERMFDLLRASFREGKNVDFDEYKKLFQTSFLRIAEVQRANGDFDKALTTYILAQEKVEERSSIAGIQMRIGDNYLAWGVQDKTKYDDAWEAYNKVITLYAATEFPPSAQYRKGEARYLAGKYEEARNDYLKLLDDYPDTQTDLLASALYSGGSSSEKLKQNDRALEIYTQVADRYPRSESAPNCLLRIGDILDSKGEGDEAQVVYQRIIDNYDDPKVTGDAKFKLGVIYKDKKDNQKAVQLFGEVPRENGRTYIAALMEAAKLYTELGKISDAKSTIAAILEGVAGDPELEALAHYQIGVLNANLRDYRGAVDEYSIVIDNYPDDKVVSNAYYGRAFARQHLQSFEKSLSDYQFVLKSDESEELKVKSQFAMAIVYTALERYDEADKLLIEVVEKADEGLQRSARLQRAAIAEREGPEKAIVRYEEILDQEKDPAERAKILLRLANAYLKTKQMEDAVKTSDALISLFETDPEATSSDQIASAFYIKGNVYYQQEDYLRAAENFGTVVRDYPNAVIALNSLLQQGLSYFNMDVERVDESIEAFEEFYQKYPDNENVPSAYYYAAWGNYRRGTWQEASDTFQTLARSYPRSRYAAEALYRSSEANFNMKKFEESLDLFQSVLDKYPDSPYVVDALYSKAWSFVRLERTEEAVPVFEKIVAEHKDSRYGENSQFTLGDYYYGKEDYENAAHEYKKYIGLFPKGELVQKANYLLGHLAEINAYRLYQQGEKLFDEDNYDEAIAIFKRVRDEFPTSDTAVNAMTNMGAAYQSREDYGEAADIYKELVQKYGDDPKYIPQTEFAKSQITALQEAGAI